MQQQQQVQQELGNSAQVAPSGTPTPQLMQQQHPPSADLSSDSTAAPAAASRGAKTHVLFYRTSYNLSAQQVTLPRGIYPLAPGDSLGIQLYIAVHPQDWDSAQYVTDRTANLRDASVTASTAAAATACAEAPGTGLAVAGARNESTRTQPRSSSSSGGDACSRGSTQQGSCSPPPQSSSSSSNNSNIPGSPQLRSLDQSVSADLLQCPEGSLPSADLAAPAPAPAAAPAATAATTAATAGAAASELPLADQVLHHSPEPCCTPLQNLSKTEAKAQELQQSTAVPAAATTAAAAASWGLGASSTLLGPFKAIVKVQTGPKEGMCRLSKVQHAGQLKGIWHRPNHTVLLYEKVGTTLVIHLKPRLPDNNNSSNNSSRSCSKKREPGKLYSLPGEGLGHQVYPGSVTEVTMHAQVVSNKTGTIPLKLPKPLLLSQFNGVSLPHSLPLDLVVDGTPAELTMQVQQAGPGSSSSSIRVQREVMISQLPRHQCCYLTGLASAGLGAYTGYMVTKIAAPGGHRIVLHLSSPAAQAAAAGTAAAAGAAAAAASGGAGAGAATPAATPAATAGVTAAGLMAAGTGGEAADGVNNTEADNISCVTDAGNLQQPVAGSAKAAAASAAAAAAAAAAAVPCALHTFDDLSDASTSTQEAGEWQGRRQDQGSVCTIAAVTPPPPPAAVPAVLPAAAAARAAAGGGGGQRLQMLQARTFWLQRLTRTQKTTPQAISAVAAAAPAAARCGGGGGAAAAAAVVVGEAGNAQGTAPVGGSELAVASAPPSTSSSIGSSSSSSSSGNSRLDMFKAILLRQQQHIAAKQQHSMIKQAQQQQQQPCHMQLGARKALPACGLPTSSSDTSSQWEAPSSCSSSSSEVPNTSKPHTTVGAAGTEAAATKPSAAADKAPNVRVTAGQEQQQQQQQQELRGMTRKRCAAESRLWACSSPDLQPGVDAGTGAGADVDAVAGEGVRADADVVACVSHKRHKGGAV